MRLQCIAGHWYNRSMFVRCVLICCLAAPVAPPVKRRLICGPTRRRTRSRTRRRIAKRSPEHLQGVPDAGACDWGHRTRVASLFDVAAGRWTDPDSNHGSRIRAVPVGGTNYEPRRGCWSLTRTSASVPASMKTRQHSKCRWSQRTENRRKARQPRFTSVTRLVTIVCAFRRRR